MPFMGSFQVCKIRQIRLTTLRMITMEDTTGGHTIGRRPMLDHLLIAVCQWAKLIKVQAQETLQAGARPMVKLDAVTCFCKKLHNTNLIFPPHGSQKERMRFGF